MRNADPFAESLDRLNALIFGEPGTGKTWLAASLGEIKRTLIVDIDRGLKTLTQVPKQWLKNLILVELDAFTDLDILYKACIKNDPAYWTKILNGRLSPEDPKYIKVTDPIEAIVMDTWSELNWEIAEEKRSIIGKQGDGSLKFRENIQIQDWGNIIDLQRLSLTAFRDAPISFICNCHEQVIVNEKLNTIRGLPSVSGKLAPEMGKYFDVVGHLVLGVQGARVLETQANYRYQAKSRIALPAKLTNPTFKVIFEEISRQALHGKEKQNGKS